MRREKMEWFMKSFFLSFLFLLFGVLFIFAGSLFPILFIVGVIFFLTAISWHSVGQLVLWTKHSFLSPIGVNINNAELIQQIIKEK